MEGKSVFYDEFIRLCNGVGKSPTAAAREMGLTGAHVNRWKNGSTPTDATVFKVCDYFGLPHDHFGGQKGSGAAIDAVDDDLREYLDELRSRPDKRLLFSVTKNATRGQIEAIVKMIEEMQGNG